jgi:hypothetical protein
MYSLSKIYFQPTVKKSNAKDDQKDLRDVSHKIFMSGGKWATSLDNIPFTVVPSLIQHLEVAMQT